MLMTEQVLEDQTFEGLDLPRADLSGKEFSRCTFRHLKLQESRWSGARLEDCVFEDCDLTRMDPSQMRALGVTFRRSKLMGADWSKVSKGPQVTFEECDLRHSAFVGTNLSKCLFHRCKASESSFVSCNLSGADFAGTNLTGSTFEDSDLTKADLSTAEGAFIDPAKNRVKGALISVESAVLLATSYGLRVAGR